MALPTGVQFEMAVIGLDKLINNQMFKLLQALSPSQRKRALKQMGMYMKKEIRRNITAGGREEEASGTWKKTKRGGKKALKGRFKTIVTTWWSGDAIAVGVRSPIAAYHQFGAKKGKWVLPARPFVMIHDFNVGAISEKLKAYIDREALRGIR